jgi:hypothetical protein
VIERKRSDSMRTKLVVNISSVAVLLLAVAGCATSARPPKAATVEAPGLVASAPPPLVDAETERQAVLKQMQEFQDRLAAQAAAAEADAVKRQQLYMKSFADRFNQLMANVDQSLAQGLLVRTSDPRSARFAEDLVWSWSDQGACEGSVQSEVQRLDGIYKSNMYAVCIWPGGLFGRVGRSCLMQRYACEAATAGFDVKAWEISVATQKHNGGGASVQYATAAEVASYLRNNLCPK